MDARIRRPRPSPRHGRRLGPPQVWSLFLLACHYTLPSASSDKAPRAQSQPHCTRQTLQRSPGLKPLKCLKPSAPAWTRHSGHSPLLLRAFQPAVCQSLKMPQTLRGTFDQTLRPQPSVVKGVQACRLPGRLPGPQMPKTLRGSFEQPLRPLPSVVKGVQACRLPGLKCLKRCAAASSRHSGHCPLLLRAFKPAVCQASNA